MPRWPNVLSLLAAVACLIFLCPGSTNTLFAQSDPEVQEQLCRIYRLEEQKDHAAAYDLAKLTLAQIDTTTPSAMEAELRQRIGYNLFWLKDQSGKCPQELEIAIKQMQYLCMNCTEFQAKTLTMLGQYHYFVKRDAALALRSLKESLNTWLLRPVHDSLEFAKTLSTLGDAYRQTGEFESAESVLIQAYDIRSKTLGPLSREALTSKFKLGAVYLEAEDYLRAKKLYSDALMDAKGLPSHDPSVLHLKNNFAVALTELGEHAEAEKHYRDLLFHYRAKGFDPDQLLATLQNLALLLIKKGEMQEAKSLLGEASALTKKHFFNDSDLAMLERDMAFFHQQNGDLRLALAHNQSAIRHFSPETSLSDLLDVPQISNVDHPELLALLKMKGELLMSGHKQGLGGLDWLKTALKCFAGCIKILDDAWHSGEGMGDKLHQSRFGSKVHALGIEACFQLLQADSHLKYLEMAFLWMEMGKSQLVVEALIDAKAAEKAKIPPIVRERISELKTSIAELTLTLDTLTEASKDRALTIIRLSDLRRQLRAMQSIVERGFPSYSQLSKRRPISNLSSVRGCLEQNEMLIEYMFSDSTLWVFSLSQDNAWLRRVPWTKAEFDLILAYREQIAGNGSANEAMVTLQLNGMKLFKILLEPDISRHPSRIDKILVIPDGPLTTFPFDALPHSMHPDPKTVKDLDFLIRHYAVRFSFSASLMNLPEAHPAEHADGFLAMAWNTTSKHGGNPGQRSTQSLPATASEIKSISKHFHGTYLSGQKAHEAAFKQLAGKFGILHLAIHGSNLDNRPRLLFPGAGQGEDGILWLEELLGQHLNAKMAVLSACETGLGTYEKGEGVMSLARGFQWAGCPTVVTSLWAVDDRATAALMQSFYEGLAHGLPVEESMHSAKLKLLKGSTRWASPAYWASFEVLGQNLPLHTRKRLSTLTFSVAFCLIALFLAITAILLSKRTKSRTEIDLRVVADVDVM